MQAIKIIGLLGILCILGACQNQEKRSQPQTLQEKKDTISLQIEKMQKSLDEKIANLATVGNNLEKDGKKKVSKLIDELKKKKRELAKSTNHLQNATEDNIDDIQKESKKTFNDISDTLSEYGEELGEWLRTHTR